MQRQAIISALRGLLEWKTVLILAMIFLWAYKFQWIQHRFPDLVTAQLKFHQLLSTIDWRERRINWVTLVIVDDDTFWAPPLSGIQPTNRKFLAELGLRAATAGASVVAFDFQFKSPYSSPGDHDVRKNDNRILLTAFRDIAARGVPIVISEGLVANGPEWQREPNIFYDSELPPGTSLGYLNFPQDHRQIPLQTLALEWDGSSHRRFSSLALQIANSFEETSHISPKTIDKKVIKTAIE